MNQENINLKTTEELIDNSNILSSLNSARKELISQYEKLEVLLDRKNKLIDMLLKVIRKVSQDASLKKIPETVEEFKAHERERMNKEDEKRMEHIVFLSENVSKSIKEVEKIILELEIKIKILSNDVDVLKVEIAA